MIVIFWRTLKDRWTTILAYSMSGFLFLLLYVSLFPTIRDQSVLLMQVVKNYPPAFLKIFGADQLDFSNFGNYLATELMSLIWPIMLVCMLVSHAGGGIAGEIESGAIELLLAQPISRRGLFWGRYLSGAVMMLAFMIATIAMAPILAILFKIDYSLNAFLAMMSLGALFGFAILSVAFLFSAWVSEKGRAYFYMGSLLILMYVFNVVATLNANLDRLKYISFFYYYKPSDALAHATISPVSQEVFLVITVTFALAAVRRFARRDLNA